MHLEPLWFVCTGSCFQWGLHDLLRSGWCSSKWLVLSSDCKRAVERWVANFVDFVNVVNFGWQGGECYLLQRSSYYSRSSSIHSLAIFNRGEHDLPHSTEYSSRSPSWRRWRRRAVARWTRWLARWKLGCGAIEMEPWWTEWKIPKAADNDKNKRIVRKKSENDSKIAKNRVSHNFVKVQAPKTPFYLNQPGQKIDLCSEHICFPPSDFLSFVNSFNMLTCR